MVIGCYLIYCLGNVLLSKPTNSLYDQYGMTHESFDLKDLKSRYRQLSLQYHPDKNSNPDAATVFARLKDSYEVLSDASKRQAYNAFGNDSLSCSGSSSAAAANQNATSSGAGTCHSYRDYLYNYLPGMLVYYGFTTAILIVMNVAGKKDYGQSFRYLAILASMAAELYVVTRGANAQTTASSSVSSSSITWSSMKGFIAEAGWFNGFLFFLKAWLTSSMKRLLIWPNLIGFHQVKVIREGSAYFFIFLSQLCPMLLPAEDTLRAKALERCSDLVGLLGKETRMQLFNAVEPFRESPEMLTRLRRRMERTAIELKLFEQDEEYRKRYLTALRKSKIA